MANFKQARRISIGDLVVAVALFAAPGCESTDLQGYKPAREHAEHAAVQTHTEDSTQVADRTVPVPATDSPDSPRINESADMIPASALVPVNEIDGRNVRAVMGLPAADVKMGTPTQATSDSTGQSKPEQPRQIELLVPEKSFRTDAKTGALRLSFDDMDLLKILNMEPVVANATDYLPDWLKAVNGKSVRLRGYMFPTFDTEGIEHFILARDNQICCFGRDPKVYDLVQVDMKPGKSTTYIPATRAFDVVGTFKIDLQFEDGKPFGLYVIENAEVIDR